MTTQSNGEVYVCVVDVDGGRRQEFDVAGLTRLANRHNLRSDGRVSADMDNHIIVIEVKY